MEFEVLLEWILILGDTKLTPGYQFDTRNAFQYHFKGIKITHYSNHFKGLMSLGDYQNRFWYLIDIRAKFQYHFNIVEVPKFPSRSISKIQKIWRIIEMNFDTLWYHFNTTVSGRFRSYISKSILIPKMNFDTIVIHGDTMWFNFNIRREILIHHDIWRYIVINVATNLIPH